MATDLSPAQAAAEAAFLGEMCTITAGPRNVDDQDFDEATGEYSGGGNDRLYVGPCGVTGGDASSTFGGRTVPLPAGKYVLKLPVSAPRIPVNALVHIDASTNDPLLPGREFSTDDDGKVGTLPLLRRIGMTEVPVAPAE